MTVVAALANYVSVLPGSAVMDDIKVRPVSVRVDVKHLKFACVPQKL